jgi:hypothetical protein
MDYTRWEKETERLKGANLESFRILFRWRFPNKLNRVMENFLLAYAKATAKTKAENRFPNLTEVQKYMEGEIYNAKRRIMKTGFFEEMGLPSGVFLLPRAKEFYDKSGTYTNLRFDFENGKVIFPVLKKGENIFIERCRKKWMELEKTSWKSVFSLERKFLYLLLLLSLLINVSLVMIIFYLIMTK